MIELVGQCYSPRRQLSALHAEGLDLAAAAVKRPRREMTSVKRMIDIVQEMVYGGEREGYRKTKIQDSHRQKSRGSRPALYMLLFLGQKPPA